MDKNNNSMPLPEFLMNEEQKERARAEKKENDEWKARLQCELPSYSESSLISNDVSFMNDELVDIIRRVIWENAPISTYEDYLIIKIDASYFDNHEKSHYIELLMGDKCIVIITNAARLDTRRTIFGNPIASYTLLALNSMRYCIVLQDKKDLMKDWFMNYSGNVGKLFVDDIRKDHDVLYLPLREEPQKEKKESPSDSDVKNKADSVSSQKEKEVVKSPKYYGDYIDSVLKNMEAAEALEALLAGDTSGQNDK